MGYALCFWETTVAAAVMAISHAKLQDAALNTERLNIAMNAANIHVKNTNTLMNMRFLSRSGGEKQIKKEQKI